jgi:hypothetical protein
MKLKYLWIVGGVLAVLIVLAMLVGNGQDKDVVNDVEQSKSIPGVFRSNYISFKYRPEYIIEDILTTDGRVLVNLKLTGERSTVLFNLRGASQDLSELTEVQMRRRNTLQYSEEVGIKGDERGLLFRTADKKERTIFLKKGARLLTITLTADSADKEWESEFQGLVDSVEW